MISESDVELNGTSAPAQLGVQLDRVDQVAVVRERERAAVVADDRLRVLPLRGAGRRVAHVADRHVADQRAQHVLVEHLRDEPLVADRHDAAAAAARSRSRPTPGRGAGARTARSRRAGRRRARARRSRRRRTRRAVHRDDRSRGGIARCSAVAGVKASSGPHDPFAEPRSRAPRAARKLRDPSSPARSSSRIAADPADHGPERRDRVLGAGDDECAPGRLAEQLETRPATSHPRAEPAGEAALGERHREAALGDVVGAESAPARTASRTAACASRMACHVGERELARRRLAPQLRELRADAAPARTGRPARSRRPRAAKPSRPARRGVGRARRRSRRPASGRSGRSAPRCRARRCRRRPGSPSARQASARPSTASVSCQATCGFSGLPKFRQLVSPSGSAPTQARLAAHSNTASAAPRARVARDAPAVAVDRDRDRATPSGSASTAASACSGRRTVRDCDDRVVLLEHRPARGDVRRAQQREQRLARPTRSPSGRAARRLVDRDRRAGSARGRTAGSRRRARATGRSRDDRRRGSSTRTRSPAGHRPDRRRQHLPALAHVRAPRPTRSGSTTHSIRSCDSEIMISNGSIPGSRSGTRATSMSSPTPPLLAISRGRRGEPGGAEVLERDEQLAVEQLEAALEQLLLGERVADLDRRALGLVALAELGAREHRRAADPVAAGQSARAARARCPGPAGAPRGSAARAGASPRHIALTRQFCS